ncbi:MAG: hypothetical protein EHM61_22215, partial [Acidobacteria bacterium]
MRNWRIPNPKSVLRNPRSIPRILLPLLAVGIFIALILGSRQVASSFQTPVSAEDRLAKGEYAEALTIYARLAGSENGSKDAKMTHLRLLLLTGKYPQAEEAALKYSASSPDPAWALMLGKARQAQGNYPEAEAAFKTAAAPQSAVRSEAAMRLALLLKETGRLDESRAEFQRLHESMAGNQANLGVAAVALQNLEQFQDANSAFRQATENNPKDVDTWNAWGWLFLEKYDKANAASVFEDALKASPNHPEALLGMAMSLSEGDAERVQSLVEKALSVNPNLVDAHVFLGRAAVEAEQFDQAADRLKKALEVNPNSLEAHSLKAVLHFARREASELEQEIQALLKINPRYGDVYEDLADYAVTQRFYEQAVGYFRKALELNPRLWTAYSGLGINLLRLGDEKAAKEALETSYNNDAFNVWTVNTLRLIDSFENF